VKAACEAAGCGAEELMGMLAVAGKAPKLEGRVADAAADLYRKISQVPNKSDFFSRLTGYQQGVLVAHLSSKGFLWLEISTELGVPIETVKAMVDEYSRQLGESIMSQTLQSIVGELAIRHAERYAMSMREGNYEHALREDQAWVKTLLDLGVTERAVQKHEVQHTLKDDVKDEIQRMLEIERKREHRKLVQEDLQRKADETTQAGSEVED
jgi:hypothetical protein